MAIKAAVDSYQYRGFLTCIFPFSDWISVVSLRSRGSESPDTVPWLSCVTVSAGPWPRVPGGLAGCSREGEHGEQEPPWGCAGPCARDRPKCLCWYLRTGSRLKAVLGTEHSLLLAEEELSERCPAPCAGIPAVLGQKLRCAMTDLQVWHPQLGSAITMLGITWLLP